MFRIITLLRRTDATQHAFDAMIARLKNGLGLQWKLIHHTPSVGIFATGAGRGGMYVRPLSGNVFIAGRLFRRLSQRDSVCVSATVGGDIASLNGRPLVRRLFDDYWGSYVYLEIDDVSGEVFSATDPSASLPCFMLKCDEYSLFFTYPPDVDFVVPPLTINSKFVTASALLPHVRKRLSPFRELIEIQPGCFNTFRSDSVSVEVLWDPVSQAKIAGQVSDTDARLLLHDVIMGVVNSLQNCFSHIVHSLGGLDSSIVLSCLSKGEASAITAVNMFTSSIGGDERSYARTLTKSLAVNLIENKLCANRVSLSRLYELSKPAYPPYLLDCTSPAGQLYETADKLSADAIFTGVGGDNVFFQVPYAFPVQDHLSTLGLSGLTRTISQTSRVSGKSIYHILVFLLKSFLLKSSSLERVMGTIYRRPSMLSADMRRRDAAIVHQALHKGLQDINSLPMGKLLHTLTSAFVSVEYVDHWVGPDGIERIHPLLSQPVIETVLRLGTWQLIDGGIDRGLARVAFDGDLPYSVARRTSKSNPDELYQNIVSLNKDLIRESLIKSKGAMLTDGVISDMMSRGECGSGADSLTLLNAFALDAWYKAWGGPAS